MGEKSGGRVATYVMLHMRWVGQKVSHVGRRKKKKKEKKQKRISQAHLMRGKSRRMEQYFKV